MPTADETPLGRTRVSPFTPGNISHKAAVDGCHAKPSGCATMSVYGPMRGARPSSLIRSIDACGLLAAGSLSNSKTQGEERVQEPVWTERQSGTLAEPIDRPARGRAVISGTRRLRHRHDWRFEQRQGLTERVAHFAKADDSEQRLVCPVAGEKRDVDEMVPRKVRVNRQPKPAGRRRLKQQPRIEREVLTLEPAGPRHAHAGRHLRRSAGGRPESRPVALALVILAR